MATPVRAWVPRLAKPCLVANSTTFAPAEVAKRAIFNHPNKGRESMNYDPNNPPAWLCIVCGLILLACAIGMAHAGYQQYRENAVSDEWAEYAERLDAEAERQAQLNH